MPPVSSLSCAFAALGGIAFASNDSVTVRQPPLKPITLPFGPIVTLRLPPPPVTGIEPTRTGNVTCTSSGRFTRLPPLLSAYCVLATSGLPSVNGSRSSGRSLFCLRNARALDSAWDLVGSVPLTDGFQSCDSSAAHTAPLAFASSTTCFPLRSDFASCVSPSLKSSLSPKICSPSATSRWVEVSCGTTR